MPSTPGRYWPVAVGVIALAGLYLAFRPSPVEVDTARVTRGAMQVTVDREGKTRVKETYVVSSPIAGRLLRIEIDPGDKVSKQSTVLATIEPTDPALLDPRSLAEAQAKLKGAEANLQRAKSLVDRDNESVKLAEHEFERAKQLRASRSGTQEDLDRAEHKLQVVREELRASNFFVQTASFELEQAKAALLRTKPPLAANESAWRYDILAPIDGQVLRVFQQSSTIVSPGTRLVEVGNPVDLECEIDVLSTDAVKIKPGDAVLIEHWGGENVLRARVRVIEPAAFTKVSALGVEEQRVWIIADFVDPFDQRKSLGDAFRVEARIVIWEGAQVLKVPTGALFRDQDGWAVFVAQAGVARMVRVSIGHRNGQEAEIVAGLDENAVVLLHPSDRIQDQTRIKIRE